MDALRVEVLGSTVLVSDHVQPRTSRSGATSRATIVEIDGLTENAVRELVAPLERPDGA